MNMLKSEKILSHTPPSFVGSCGPSAFKRSRTFDSGGDHEEGLASTGRERSGSISGRLRSASFLCDEGVITPQQKGVVKDLIIAGNKLLEEALKSYEKGDSKELKTILESGYLNRKSSLDLDYDLDMSFLNMGLNFHGTPIGSMEKGGFTRAFMGLDNHDIFQMEDTFELTFGIDAISGLANLDKLPVSFGRSPPVPFSSSNDKCKQAPPLHSEGSLKATSSSINIKPTPDLQSADDLAFSFASKMSFDEADVMQQVHMYMQNVDVNDEFFFSGSYTLGAPMELAGSAGSNGNFLTFLDDFDGDHFLSSPMTLSPSFIPLGISPPILGIMLPPAHDNSISSRQDSKTSAPIVIPHGNYSMRSNSSKNDNGYIGAYSPESRKRRIDKFHQKRRMRVWTKVVKYDVRKNFADRRVRVKGRFVKKGDESLLREIMNMVRILCLLNRIPC